MCEVLLTSVLGVVGGDVEWSPMECTLALVADYAAFDASGKLNVVGAFTDLHSPDLPALVGQVALVASFEGDPSESGQEKEIRIRLTDGDARNTLFEHESRQQVGSSESGTPVKLNVLIYLQGLSLPEWGHYAVYFHINGEHKRTVALRLHQIQPKH